MKFQESSQGILFEVQEDFEEVLKLTKNFCIFLKKLEEIIGKNVRKVKNEINQILRNSKKTFWKFEVD